MDKQDNNFLQNKNIINSDKNQGFQPENAASGNEMDHNQFGPKAINPNKRGEKLSQRMVNDSSENMNANLSGVNGIANFNQNNIHKSSM